ncbi:MAG: capsule assembly Wzi family protein [Cyclobacteriaceae bacterium]
MDLKFGLQVILLLPSWIFSQVQIPGDYHSPIDKARDTTTLTLFTSTQPMQEDGFSWNDIYFKATKNSRYARGYNDGPVWKGVGRNIEMHGGLSGKTGKLTYTINPVFFYSKNKFFSIPDLQPSTTVFAYPYSSQIDWVQRYGQGVVGKGHPGQSEVRLDVGKVVASIGTQNYSLGPAIYNPILLGRQAGGFPHVRMGMKPTYLSSKKNIAKVEANVIYGLLKESEYFDNDPDNNNRYFNGLFFAFTPSILPELTIGFNKVLYKQTRYFQGRDLISPLFIIDDGVVDGDTLSPNDAFDQMASISLEWNLRESGFRAYVEFAKNDFTSDGAGLRPTAVEPEHSRGYTIGFEKILKNKKNTELVISYEHTNLSIGHQPWRPTPPFYAHGINRQGYTHDGQIIGAGIGPGGNSDNLGIRMKKTKLSAFLLLQRIERDRDYFVRQIRNPNLHNIEYSLTTATQLQFEKYDLFVEATLSQNYSWNYQFNDVVNFSYGFGGRLKL